MIIKGQNFAMMDCEQKDCNFNTLSTFTLETLDVNGPGHSADNSSDN